MEVPRGAERFTFPNACPSSPPATPDSSRSRNTSAESFAANGENKQHGFINLGLSPPENLEPRGIGHQFSYTPPDREDECSDSSLTGDVDLSAEESGPIPEFESEDEIAAHRPSIVDTVGEETVFTVEEILENDISYDSDTKVVKPDQTEDAESEKDVTEADGLHDKDLLDALKNLHCDPRAQEKAQEFEEAQRKKYRKKKDRWSVGGRKKRSHTESVGSDSSDNADIELVEDSDQLGASARRLRRRTQGPADAERPRTSLLFDQPPAEIEEMIFNRTTDVPHALVLESDDEWTSDDEESDAEESDAEEDMLVPSWLMEIDSEPSRPSTAGD